MKKTLMITMALALLGAVALSAQSPAPAGRRADRETCADRNRLSREPITVEGTLAFRDSVPVISTKDGDWILPPGPFYQLAYQNNLKEGATIKAEGFAAQCPPAREDDKSAKQLESAKGVLVFTKLAANGKELDLSALGGFGRGGPGPMMGRGWGDDDDEPRGRRGDERRPRRGRGGDCPRWED